MRKAQITVFMIIGVLVLFALGFLIYFKGAVTKAVEQRPVDIQPVVSHVIHCLDMTATDALDLVGKQGGVIYISQGGLTLDPVCPDQCIDFRGHKVYLDITPTSEGCNYPRPYYPYHKNRCTGEEDWIEPVGETKLPPLEHGPHSIKANLESYINNNTKKCLDFSLFKDFIIHAGDVSSSVLIARNDVTVFIYFPINITTQTTKNYVDEFTIKEDIRLRKVYNFVKDELIHNDIWDAHYIIHGQSAEGGTITAIVGWNIGNSDPDNIVLVEDLESILKFRDVENQIYKFWFGVKNRQPALGCIREAPPYGPACPGQPLVEVVRPKPEEGWGVDDTEGVMLPESVRPDELVYTVDPPVCPPCGCPIPGIILIKVDAFLTDEAGVQDCKLNIPVLCKCCPC